MRFVRGMRFVGGMRLEGSIVALVTPFDARGGIDEDAYRALIRRQIKAGSAGLVPCGSTGEAATLRHEEYRRAVEIACEESRGDVPVIAGIGANATWKAVEQARQAATLGADGLLVLAPYYNKPTQDGLYQHYRAVARQSRLPVVIYNIPGRSAVNILPKTVARITKDCPNVVAIKEASGSLDQVSDILCLCGSRLTVLSGDDSLTVPMMSIGARGVVSVLANVAPRETAALCAAALRGDFRRAGTLHRRLFGLTKALFIETNPIPVKAALGMMGLCRPSLRLPLTPLSAENRPLLKKALQELRIS